MENYSKAVSEMYSQFEKREAHPAEKYIGRFANFYGKKLEVVGYSHNDLADVPTLIVEASPFGGWSELIVEALPFGGWSELEPSDVIFKECKSYWYANIKDLID